MRFLLKLMQETGIHSIVQIFFKVKRLMFVYKEHVLLLYSFVINNFKICLSFS